MFLDRCKKGITLDLKNPKGKELFMELVKKSDVIMENFSAGTMDRLGLGWDVLQSMNSGIIYASISGFGHTGPWADRRSFDPIAQATSGYMTLMKDAINPEGPPLQAPDAIADTIPGFTALIGILAALNYRNKTGKGQRVDVAQMDSMIAVMQSYSFWNIVKKTFSQALIQYRVGVSGLYKTQDGFIMFSLPPGRITEWFKELMGVEELTHNVVNEWVLQRTSDEVIDILAKTGIPVGHVYDLDEVQSCEQAIAREMFTKVHHPILGEIVEPGFPIKFSETKGDLSIPAPLLGEHTNEIFTKVLELSKEELNELRKEGVI
jgi:crotonobetainyl-CoA:carnitine CoA-transferase CaiB-like acyl-CoA transferase